MKKVIALLALSSMLGISASALATNTPPAPDGKDIRHFIDCDAIWERDFWRKVCDPSVGNQTADLSVPVKALVPCYLEMKFTGNEYNASLKSFGYGSNASIGPELQLGLANIAFFPEISGFIKGNWSPEPNSISVRAEIEPREITDPNLSYIRACDTFSTSLWSNLDYKYSVKIADGGLKRVGGDDNAKRNMSLQEKVLPLDMRYYSYKGKTIKALNTIAAGDWVTAQFKPKSAPGANDGVDTAEIVKFGALPTTPDESGNACEYTNIYHQFRIPYTRDFMAGLYKGEVEFLAATI